MRVVVSSALALALPMLSQAMYKPGQTTKAAYPIDGEWIATVRGPAGSCGAFKTQVAQVQAKYSTLRGGKPIVPKSVELPDTEDCLVLFYGSDAVRMDARGLANVLDVEPHMMFQLQAFGDQDPSVSPLDPISWGLNRVDQSALPLSFGAHFTEGYTGKGVRVYMLDSGVNMDHLDFKGRLTCAADYINTPTSGCIPEDEHGTHTTGTSSGSMAGIARDATIYHLRVCGKDGCPGLGLSQAQTWVINNEKAVRKSSTESAVLSFSIGGPKSTSSDSSAQAVSNAGIIMVVAAGNDNADACSYSPAAAGGKARSAYSVITVGSTDKYDHRSSFSNYGKCVDIYAPGSDIVSAVPGSNQAWGVLSGTSMACPHVAGVVATLLEKHAGDKKKAMDELFSTALPNTITDPTNNTTMTFGNYFLQATRGALAQTKYPGFVAPAYAQVCVGSDCFANAPSAIGPALTTTPVTGLLAFPAASEPLDGCNKTTGATFTNNYAGKVLVIARGTCAFIDKARNAMKAGAKAVILTNNVAGDPIPAGSDGTVITIPVLMISLDARAAIQDKSGATVVMGIPTATAAPVGGSPTAAPVAAPTTAAPVVTPTTAAPVVTPTTKAPVTAAPSTAAPVVTPTKAPVAAAPSTAAPVVSPTTKAPVTAAPNAAPTTPAPKAKWQCPAYWFNVKDGCDCECSRSYKGTTWSGATNVDPDCLVAGQAVYCGGNEAAAGVTCDLVTDKCVAKAGFGGEGSAVAFTGANKSAEEPSSFPLGAVVGGAVAFVALVVGSALLVRRKRAADAAPHSAVANPAYGSDRK
jgi:subtilisin family serine protease